MCVLTKNKRYRHIEQDFYSVAWAVSQGWDFGVLGCQKLIFFKQYHIKMKGMMSRTGYNKKKHPRVKLVTLGWGQISFFFFESVGIYDIAPSTALSCLFSYI